MNENELYRWLGEVNGKLDMVSNNLIVYQLAATSRIDQLERQMERDKREIIETLKQHVTQTMLHHVELEHPKSA